eukprot:GHVH01010858.1.p1 GENE.GHVH01010858.1~~GHVH01010858.1.p1  ORF type:complete len:1177 (+),score=132.35 GHVH01010858.1:297-3827(+)
MEHNERFYPGPPARTPKLYQQDSYLTSTFNYKTGQGTPTHWTAHDNVPHEDSHYKIDPRGNRDALMTPGIDKGCEIPLYLPVAGTTISAHQTANQSATIYTSTVPNRSMQYSTQPSVVIGPSAQPAWNVPTSGRIRGLTSTHEELHSHVNHERSKSDVHLGSSMGAFHRATSPNSTFNEKGYHTTSTLGQSRFIFAKESSPEVSSKVDKTLKDAPTNLPTYLPSHQYVSYGTRAPIHGSTFESVAGAQPRQATSTYFSSTPISRPSNSYSPKSSGVQDASSRSPNLWRNPFGTSPEGGRSPGSAWWTPVGEPGGRQSGVSTPPAEVGTESAFIRRPSVDHYQYKYGPADTLPPSPPLEVSFGAHPRPSPLYPPSHLSNQPSSSSHSHSYSGEHYNRASTPPTAYPHAHTMMEESHSLNARAQTRSMVVNSAEQRRTRSTVTASPAYSRSTAPTTTPPDREVWVRPLSEKIVVTNADWNSTSSLVDRMYESADLSDSEDIVAEWKIYENGVTDTDPIDSDDEIAQFNLRYRKSPGGSYDSEISGQKYHNNGSRRGSVQGIYLSPSECEPLGFKIKAPAHRAVNDSNESVHSSLDSLNSDLDRDAILHSSSVANLGAVGEPDWTLSRDHQLDSTAGRSGGKLPPCSIKDKITGMENEFMRVFKPYGIQLPERFSLPADIGFRKHLPLCQTNYSPGDYRRSWSVPSSYKYSYAKYDPDTIAPFSRGVNRQGSMFTQAVLERAAEMMTPDSLQTPKKDARVFRSGSWNYRLLVDLRGRFISSERSGDSPGSNSLNLRHVIQFLDIATIVNLRRVSRDLLYYLTPKIGFIVDNSHDMNQLKRRYNSVIQRLEVEDVPIVELSWLSDAKILKIASDKWEWNPLEDLPEGPQGAMFTSLESFTLRGPHMGLYMSTLSLFLSVTLKVLVLTDAPRCSKTKGGRNFVDLSHLSQLRELELGNCDFHLTGTPPSCVKMTLVGNGTALTTILANLRRPQGTQGKSLRELYLRNCLLVGVHLCLQGVTRLDRLSLKDCMLGKGGKNSGMVLPPRNGIKALHITYSSGSASSGIVGGSCLEGFITNDPIEELVLFNVSLPHYHLDLRFNGAVEGQLASTGQGWEMPKKISRLADFEKSQSRVVRMNKLVLFGCNFRRLTLPNEHNDGRHPIGELVIHSNNVVDGKSVLR